MNDRLTVDSINSDQLDALYARRDQLASLLDEVLRQFVHKGHPGEPCLQTGWVSVRTVDRWRTALYQPTPAPAATEATEPVQPTPAAEDDPPVQCWHTEADTPCDWNVCKQPERLAAGDNGTDPRGH